MENVIQEQNNNIYSALVKARAEFKPVLFDKVNPHFRSRFASINSINDSTVEYLSKYGLMIIQPWKHLENGDIILETIIIHSSGERITSSCIIKAGKTDQQFGASCTYMRRYQLSSLLNIVGEDDDDGESNQGRVSPPVDLKQKPPQSPNPQPQPAPMAPKGLSDKQIELLQGKIKKHPDLENWILKKYSVPKVTDISWSQLSEVLEIVKNKEAKEGVVSEPKSGQ